MIRFNQREAVRCISDALTPTPNYQDGFTPSKQHSVSLCLCGFKGYSR